MCGIRYVDRSGNHLGEIVNPQFVPEVGSVVEWFGSSVQCVVESVVYKLIPVSVSSDIYKQIIVITLTMIKE